MDDNINKIMLPFLDSESQFHYLQYYLNKELQEAIDAELGEEEEMNIVYKMECLYEWWATEQYICRYTMTEHEIYDSDEDDSSSGHSYQCEYDAGDYEVGFSNM